MTPGAGTGLGTVVLADATGSLCTGHPAALLREGGGSTPEGTTQRCPLLPTASGLFPSLSPPPPVPSIPCSCALPPPSGQGVWAGAGLLGAARPTARCHLPACCCHGVSAKGESRYRNGSCSTSSLPCTGGKGGGGRFGPAPPRGSRAGKPQEVLGGRSGPVAVRPLDGTRRPQPSRPRGLDPPASPKLGRLLHPSCF